MNPRKFSLGEDGFSVEGFIAKLTGNGTDPDDPEDPRNKIRRDILPAVLAYQYQDHCRRLTDPTQLHKFQVGDLITWKRGMNTHRWPVRGEPVVVTAVLEKPRVVDDPSRHGTPYWHEELDIKVGYLSAKNGEFLEFHADSRRYQPWTPEMMEEALLDTD